MTPDPLMTKGIAALFLVLTLVLAALTVASSLKRYDKTFDRIMSDLHPHLGACGHPDHPEYQPHRAPLFFGILTAAHLAAFLVTVFR